MESTPDVVVPGMRLGKLPPKFDKRTLRLARYIPKWPIAPHSHSLSKKTLKAFPVLGEMKNDSLGDCTCAAIGHLFQGWSTYGGKPWRPTDEQVVEVYNKVNNGVDEGAAMLDVLNVMRRDGMGGNKIYAFVAVDIMDYHDHLKLAHYLFGGLYLGANLPVSAQEEKAWEKTSGPGSEPGSWGGHAMAVFDYSAKGVTFVTWGKLKFATWDWVDRYCDEAYAILEEDYIGADHQSPQGFSLKKLEADLKAL